MLLVIGGNSPGALGVPSCAIIPVQKHLELHNSHSGNVLIDLIIIDPQLHKLFLKSWPVSECANKLSLSETFLGEVLDP